MRFCSNVCRYASMRTTRSCKSCGKEFSRKSSEVGDYCSVSCSPGRPRNEKNHITKICPGCRESFSCPRYKETTYCSKSCRTRYSNITQQCGYCGKEFTYPRSWPRDYCSRKCYGRARNLGGRHYYGANWQVQRAFAIVRDQGACADCNSTNDLHVHHIASLRSFDGNWELANRIDNLVTVCPPCHLKRHGGRYS
jgi:HNH endonuclease